MKSWLAEHYVGLLAFLLVVVFFFLYMQERAANKEKAEVLRKATPVEMETWNNGSGYVCFILNHNRPNQDMDCEPEAYSDPAR